RALHFFEVELEVRRIEDDKAIYQRGEALCNRPSDNTAPIVSHDMRPGISRCFYQRYNVGNEIVQFVRVFLPRPIRKIVPSQVRGPYREAGCGQRGNLPMPRMPIFRETVEQDDRRANSG